MKVVRLPALRTGRLYSPGSSVNPKAKVRQEVLRKWRISATPPRIELATFRLVQHCLNQLHHCVPPPPYSIGFKKEWLYASTPPRAFMAFTRTTERVSADTNPTFIFGNFLVLIRTNLPTANTAISVVLFSLSRQILDHVLLLTPTTSFRILTYVPFLTHLLNRFTS